MARTRPTRPLFALAAAAALAGPVAAAPAFVTIATGEVTGVYYQAGGGLCDLVNAGRNDHRIRCTVAGSAGGVANVDALRRGEHAFGFAHADVVRQAHEGGGIFAGQEPFNGLRVVLALYPETVTLVARADAGIGALRDLRGRRVGIGPEGSGQRASMGALLEALGWTRDDFGASPELGAAERAMALCDGRIDAALFVTGHPNIAVKQALTCDTRLVPVAGTAVERLVEALPQYHEAVIPGGAYAGVDGEVPSYGVTALLLTSTEAAPETVHAVSRAVLERVESFSSWHPALAGLQPGAMARRTVAIGAPLHPGAVTYYAESGLLRE